MTPGVSGKLRLELSVQRLFGSPRSNNAMPDPRMIGKVLISENLSVVAGYNTKEINLENVSKGIYMISVQTEDGNAQSLRLIVE